MIEVIRAPAFATVQDAGRPGFRRSGVPPGGAMDRAALQTGNTVVGNSLDAAAIEWALTGGTLRFTAALTIALAGARTVARLDGASVPHATPVTAAAGSILEIDRLARGRFCYVCVRGGLDVPTVLGGRGTYLPAQFGGLDGRLLRSGDRLGVGTATARSVPAAESAPIDTLDESAPITVVAGPQASVLSAREWKSLLGTELLVSAHSDRSGYRLTGFQRESSYTADAESEPSCVGAVQLTPDGTLIVLMPDGPTVTGYPKVAVVTSRSIARVAQRATGAAVRLELVELQETLTSAAPPG